MGLYADSSQITASRYAQVVDATLRGRAALLVEPRNRDARDPRRFAGKRGVARIEGGHPFQIVLVDEIDELAEPRADEHHVGRGKRERQPLRALGVVGLVRFKRVVAKLRPRSSSLWGRADICIFRRRFQAGNLTEFCGGATIVRSLFPGDLHVINREIHRGDVG